MKHIILTLLLAIVFFAYSQNTIIVNYEILSPNVKLNDKLMEDPIANDLYKKIDEYKSYINYELTGTKKGFIFKKNILMNNDTYDEEILNIASLVVGFPDAEYDKTEDKLYELFDNVKILNKKNYRWVITDSVKYIDNIKCIYAMGFCDRDSNGKMHSTACSAWFSPEMFFNYGPSCIMNLPGLVLEFEIANKKVVAKKIELIDKETVLKFSKNRIVTSGEFINAMPYKP